MSKKIVIGCIGHVDAGKTTLSEGLLYFTKSISALGRVDHKDAFLDYNQLEKNKGITIFSKTARFNYEDTEFIYVDTPGHIELIEETNRTLKILDACILIISSTDSSYSGSFSLFKELEELNIPIFIFMNKMDIAYNNQNEILNKLKEQISNKCINVNDLEEHVSLKDETLLDKYLNTNAIDNQVVCDSLINHDYYPVIYGSALKLESIDILLNSLNKYLIPKEDSDILNAYIYKVSLINNERLCHLKVLSGTLNNKTSFNSDNKINEIYLANGNKLESVQSVKQNDLCLVKGLKNLSVGTYLPSLVNNDSISINSLKYLINSPLNANELYKKLVSLNDEFPELNISLENNNVYLYLKGELQKDIITYLIKERYSLDINYSKPIITYKETIKDSVIGIGHYEPLRHYGEVLVKLEPNDNGLKFKANYESSNMNNLLKYLKDYPLKGILTNSELTNVKITILDLKTHPKHTEGLDLVESLKRAIRQALMKANNILLEPYYSLILDNDLESKMISFLSRENIDYEISNDKLIASVRVNDYTDILLKLKTLFKNDLNIEIKALDYKEVNNQDEIIEKINYNPLLDTDNLPGSIFCVNGGGHYIEYNEVEDYMHLDMSAYKEKEYTSITHNRLTIKDEELKRVFNNTYKQKERYKPTIKKDEEISNSKVKSKPILYLIDGYNLMYESNEFKEIANKDLTTARIKTTNLICDFAGYVNAECIVIYDAYKRENLTPMISEFDNITVVYTKINQTADMYIENKANELKDEYKINVVTSDALEQLKVYSSEAFRISSREFYLRYENMKKNNQKIVHVRNKPFSELRKLLEEE